MSWLILIWDIVRPRVIVQLLEAQRDTAPFSVYRQHLAFELLVFFQHFIGMADLARPRHIGNVQQAINAFFQFNKCSIIRKVAYLSIDNAVSRITVRNFVPWVLGGLLHPQGELLPFLVNGQNDDINFVVDFHEFTGMVDTPCPGHLTDVYESLDSRLQFDKRAVTHHVDHDATLTGLDGIFLGNVFPRIGLLLLEAERNFLFFSIDIEDLDFDFLVDRHHL